MNGIPQEGGVLAIGRWDGTVAMAMRWNGNEAKPNGTRQVGGAIWFIVPDKWLDCILGGDAPLSG